MSKKLPSKWFKFTGDGKPLREKFDTPLKDGRLTWEPMKKASEREELTMGDLALNINYVSANKEKLTDALRMVMRYITYSTVVDEAFITNVIVCSDYDNGKQCVYINPLFDFTLFNEVGILDIFEEDIELNQYYEIGLRDVIEPFLVAFDICENDQNKFVTENYLGVESLLTIDDNFYDTGEDELITIYDRYTRNCLLRMYRRLEFSSNQLLFLIYAANERKKHIIDNIEVFLWEKIRPLAIGSITPDPVVMGFYSGLTDQAATGGGPTMRDGEEALTTEADNLANQARKNITNAKAEINRPDSVGFARLDRLRWELDEAEKSWHGIQRIIYEEDDLSTPARAALDVMLEDTASSVGVIKGIILAELNTFEVTIDKEIEVTAGYQKNQAILDKEAIGRLRDEVVNKQLIGVTASDKVSNVMTMSLIRYDDVTKKYVSNLIAWREYSANQKTTLAAAVGLPEYNDLTLLIADQDILMTNTLKEYRDFLGDEISDEVVLVNKVIDNINEMLRYQVVKDYLVSIDLVGFMADYIEFQTIDVTKPMSPQMLGQWYYSYYEQHVVKDILSLEYKTFDTEYGLASNAVTKEINTMAARIALETSRIEQMKLFTARSVIRGTFETPDLDAYARWVKMMEFVTSPIYKFTKGVGTLIRENPFPTIGLLAGGLVTAYLFQLKKENRLKEIKIVINKLFGIPPDTELVAVTSAPSPEGKKDGAGAGKQRDGDDLEDLDLSKEVIAEIKRIHRLSST